MIPDPGRPGWTDLVTLDVNADHSPDVVHDLESVPLPFADETFDEIHAYEVLEHTGAQGDHVFLDQDEYVRQVGVTAMSDFRYLYRADFRLVYHQVTEHRVFFALQAVKPSRYQAP